MSQFLANVHLFMHSLVVFNSRYNNLDLWSYNSELVCHCSHSQFFSFLNFPRLPDTMLMFYVCISAHFCYIIHLVTSAFFDVITLVPCPRPRQLIIHILRSKDLPTDLQAWRRWLGECVWLCPNVMFCQGFIPGNRLKLAIGVWTRFSPSYRTLDTLG